MVLLNPDDLRAIADDLSSALEKGDIEQAAVYAVKLSSARAARVIKDIPVSTLLDLIGKLPPDKAAHITAYLPYTLSSEILGHLGDKAALIFSKIPEDRAADILQTLPQEQREALLSGLDRPRRKALGGLIRHAPDSVGSRMITHFVAVKKTVTVRQCLDALLAGPTESERPVYVYVVEDSGVLCGVVSLRDMLRFNSDERVENVMTKTVIAAYVDDAAVEAAKIMRDRRFMVLPVVSEDRTLIGVMTFDDAMRILADEVASNFSAIAGHADESFFTPTRQSVKFRLPWMALNVFLNLGAVAVITQFETTIAQVALLAAFIPMITDMGGNVGIQSLSVAIRSLALSEARTKDVWKAVRKEISIGLINGAALGVLFAVLAFVIKGSLWLSVLAGVALGVNVLVAGIVGGFLPFILKALGKDPAMMTGPFLTTITDITGVSIYLGLSTIFLALLL